MLENLIRNGKVASAIYTISQQSKQNFNNLMVEYYINFEHYSKDFPERDARLKAFNDIQDKYRRD